MRRRFCGLGGRRSSRRGFGGGSLAGRGRGGVCVIGRVSGWCGLLSHRRHDGVDDAHGAGGGCANGAAERGRGADALHGRVAQRGILRDLLPAFLQTLGYRLAGEIGGGAAHALAAELATDLAGEDSLCEQATRHESADAGAGRRHTERHIASLGSGLRIHAALHRLGQHLLLHLAADAKALRDDGAGQAAGHRLQCLRRLRQRLLQHIAGIAGQVLCRVDEPIRALEAGRELASLRRQVALKLGVVDVQALADAGDGRRHLSHADRVAQRLHHFGRARANLGTEQGLADALAEIQRRRERAADGVVDVGDGADNAADHAVQGLAAARQGVAQKRAYAAGWQRRRLAKRLAGRGPPVDWRPFIAAGSWRDTHRRLRRGGRNGRALFRRRRRRAGRRLADDVPFAHWGIVPYRMRTGRPPISAHTWPFANSVSTPSSSCASACGGSAFPPLS